MHLAVCSKRNVFSIHILCKKEASRQPNKISLSLSNDLPLSRLLTRTQSTSQLFLIISFKLWSRSSRVWESSRGALIRVLEPRSTLLNGYTFLVCVCAAWSAWYLFISTPVIKPNQSSLLVERAVIHYLSVILQFWMIQSQPAWGV